MFPTPGWDGLPLPHTGTDFAWLLASLCIAYVSSPTLQRISQG